MIDKVLLWALDLLVSLKLDLENLFYAVEAWALEFLASLGLDLGRVLYAVELWALGLLVSLGLGHVVTVCFVHWIRQRAGCDDRMYENYLLNVRASSAEPALWRFLPRPVSPVLQGIVERLVFTVMFGMEIPATAPAMMTWLAAKMLTNLNRANGPQHEIVTSRALTGFLGTTVSLFFAFLGGQICGRAMPAP